MKTLYLLSLFVAGLLVLVFATPPQSADAWGKACSRTKFKSKYGYVEKACKTDQRTAKKAMKDFVKAVKKSGLNGDVTCQTCHTKASGKFPLTKKGLKLFEQWFPKVKDHALVKKHL